MGHRSLRFPAAIQIRDDDSSDTRKILEAVVAAFVLTQVAYAVVNCGLLAVLLRRPTNVVDERTLGRVLEAGGAVDRERGDGGATRVHADGGRTDAADRPLERESDDPGPPCRLPPALRRPIRVFVPLVDHRWGGLEATLESVDARSYPTALVSVTVVYEPRETDGPELEGALDADRPPGLAVETFAVDPEWVASDRDGGERPWWVTGTAPEAMPLALRLLVGFNGLTWAYYGVRFYRAAWDAIPFRSHAHTAAYSLLSNPLSQALYAMLSAVPICLGIADAVRGESAPLESSAR